MKNLEIKLGKTSAICIALVSVYYGIYSFAYGEYEKEVSNLEKKIDLVRHQVNAKNGHFAWDKIAYLQHIHIPEKPSFFYPYSIWSSIFGQKIPSGKHIYELQEIIQENRGELSNKMLQGLMLTKEVMFLNNTIMENHYNKDFTVP